MVVRRLEGEAVVVLQAVQEVAEVALPVLHHHQQRGQAAVLQRCGQEAALVEQGKRRDGTEGAGVSSVQRAGGRVSGAGEEARRD